MIETAKEAYEWMEQVFDLPRSLTGRGIRKTLRSIMDNLAIEQNCKIYKCKTGTKVFDWEIPEEWDFNRCEIIDEHGSNIINENLSLQVINFSEFYEDKLLGRDVLAMSIIGDKKNPDSIPYVTSYYKRTSGFCLSHNQAVKIEENKYYQVLIDTKHSKGNLEFLEYVVPGKTKEEILFSTYCCHPELANNELSGPALTMLIANESAT